MATLPLVSGHNTLIDIAKSFDPDGKVAVLAELLNQSNEIVYDMNFIEGNLPTGHKSVVRTSLPSVALREFYKGVPVSKSGRATVEDVAAMQEGRNEIDKDLADLNGNSAAFRMSEALGFVESMNETFAQQIFYGNTATNKDGILGLTPRYSSLTATSGANVINAGGTGNTNTSVWLVGWGENTCTGFYPKGSKAGLVQEDLGVIDAFDSNQNRFRAYAELWQWKYGLCVKDWRYVVRIANISVSDLNAQTGTQAVTSSTWLNKLMIRALARMPSSGMARFAFYANRSVKEMLSIGALDKSQNALSFTEALNQYGTVGPGSVAGQGTGITGGVLKFQGVPVRTVDQLLLTESAVS
jgi:hypothetical protein